MDKDYGKDCFVRGMEEFKGKIVTIESAKCDYYHIREDKYKYGWTDEMLEPVVMNWDKVKEGAKEALEKMNVNNWNNNIFCDSIHAVRGEKNCLDRACRACKGWLKQPYKEPSILDNAEKEYLRAVIKPWRDKVAYIVLVEYSGSTEYIRIKIKDEPMGVSFPNFKVGKMYKGMVINKRYSLKDLGL